MDRDRIKTELRKSQLLAPTFDEVVYFAEHIAKIARSEALEESAKVCERVEREKWESLRLGGAKDCYLEIRALKDK